MSKNMKSDSFDGNHGMIETDDMVRLSEQSAIK
jgi:hypothetical protein